MDLNNIKYQSEKDINNEFLCRNIFGNLILDNNRAGYIDISLIDSWEEKLKNFKESQNDTIQSLWIGDSLSDLEIMSINSYLATHKKFHLYVYKDIKNVPNGVTLKDASEIWTYEESMEKLPSGLQAISNFFRLQLLFEKGGYWVDLDNISLKKYDFKTSYVFGRDSVDFYNNNVIKAPKRSTFLGLILNDLREDLYDDFESSDNSNVEYGPNLLSKYISYYDYDIYATKKVAFNCLSYDRVHELFLDRPNKDLPFNLEVYSIHLFNDSIKKLGYDKTKKYPKNSIYECLKERFL
jgi:hypothetical protein